GHDDLERLGRGDPGLPGLADAGAVLGRDPGSVEDRLALAEQVGMVAASGLVRPQPLQRRRRRPAMVADDDAPRLADLNGERPAAPRVALAEGVGEGAALPISDRFDLIAV